MKTKKAPTGAATSARAVGGKSGETVSILNFTTDGAGRQAGLEAITFER